MRFTGLPRYLVIGIAVAAVYVVASLAGLPLVELLTGAVLALYVPGSVLVNLRQQHAAECY